MAMHRRRSVLAFVVLVVLVLAPAACSSDDSDDVKVQGTPPVVGTFLSTSVTGYTLAPGTRITVTFDEAGTLSANAGCNHLSGDFTVEGSTLIVGEGLAMTEMGCDQARQDQDQWLANVLTDRPTLAVNDDSVTITSPGATLTLQNREVADPDWPLVGTKWQVDTVVSGDTAGSMPSEVPVVITFADDGTLTVSNGCAGLAGSYEVAGDEITFGELAATKTEGNGKCPALAPPNLSGTLKGTLRYTIEANRLTLSGAGDDGIGAIAQE
jgi:heat shock protein HslJ